MGTIFVDSRPCEADPSRNLLEVCLSLGFNLPYFCWHPAMGSVGACRQCAVKQFRDEHDQRGRIVMACLTPAAEGTRISIEDPEARAFRAGIIEGLMLNHPHDCPVCDEGGECHLQDMTVMTGHDYRQYGFHKRTFRNQYLGPLLNHEMNRCIQCYRCVRFYREYAGGRDLNAFGLRDLVYFGRNEDGVLENEFSGNLAEVCPTGVFTDKTLRRHYTRKWDLQMAPSVCVHCGLGCNIDIGERYGRLRRVVNRYHGDVNGYFLCDRGRFGYEFVASGRRVREARVLRDGGAEFVTKSAALDYLQAILSGNGKVIGVGSPRASLEANFALRALAGAENFYAGVADDQARLLSTILQILRRGPAPTASLRDVECSDAVLVLGEDVTNVAARMALSLRQAVRQQPMEIAEKLEIPLWLDHAVREAVQEVKGPFFVATPQATKLDVIATETFRGAPDDIARLGFAVANLLDPRAPAPAGGRDQTQSLAARIAGPLRAAKRPLVVAGPSCNSEAILHAAANVAAALHAGGAPARVAFTMPECNSCGLALMGAGSLGSAFKAVRAGTADTAVILENDLYRRAPREAVDEFLNACRHVVVLDSLENQTTAKAELLLPAATFAEDAGTLVSSEGRAQRFFAVFDPEYDGDMEASWRWLRSALAAAGRQEAAGWNGLEEVTAALTRAIPALAHIREAAPPATFRAAEAKIPRQPHRYSGRTAMNANISVHEPKTPEDSDSPLSFSMEGYPDQPPSALTPFFWSPGWNSCQAVNKFQSEIAGPLRGGNPGVRLVEPGGERRWSYYQDIPNPFRPRLIEWLLVPLYHLFGSEELSMAAPAIEELAPKPCVMLNAEDAGRIGAAPGEELEISLGAATHRVPLKIDPELPRGIAGIPVGFPGSNVIPVPAWSRISRVL